MSFPVSVIKSLLMANTSYVSEGVGYVVKTGGSNLSTIASSKGFQELETPGIVSVGDSVFINGTVALKVLSPTASFAA